jgi:hypothetical protein
MRPLSEAELLQSWEEGHGRTPVGRAVALVAAAMDAPAAEAARLPLGDRDARLMLLREWTFGEEMSGVINCPSCDEYAELTVRLPELRARVATVPDALIINAGECEICFRLPDSLDLDMAARCPDLPSARSLLVERCLLSAAASGRAIPAADLPAAAILAVAAAIEEADPLADVRLLMTCTSCGHTWSEAFDIAEFFWCELEIWAHRVLRDVHMLASTYHWSEADILALSPARRRIYLDLAGG